MYQMSFNSKNRLTKVKLAVFGDKQVGKTAFAVRYLTKRFIGEYDSNKDMLYTHRAMIDKDDITIDLLDCSSQNEDTLKDNISWADGYILMFSVTSKQSLAYIGSLHSMITKTAPNSPGVRPNCDIPLVIVGNKTDLLFSRIVTETEGCEMSEKLESPIYELSVAENGGLVNEVVEEVIRQVKREGVKAREGVDKSMLNTVKRVLKKKIYRSKSDTV